MNISFICLGLAMVALAIIKLNTNSGLPGKGAEKYFLNLRSQIKAVDGSYKVEEKKVVWVPQKTAFIIVDMWDDHWCKSAAERVGELAGPMNEVIKYARAQGSLIIHAPSSVTSFYNNTPQRKKAQMAPFAITPKPLSTYERWGTNWCWPDESREEALPIDDSDMGCDCQVKCEIRDAWTRQIATIEIAPEDAITDDGQETFNLLAQHGIENIVLLGVHLNMCVLGRPFGIRQMVQQGKNVVLMRDMTDTMYNHEMEPRVSHFEGTRLVIEHIEKFWCPSILSTDITGKPAFNFKDDFK
ncbi:isochorismatase family protein [soil metagenome]